MNHFERLPAIPVSATTEMYAIAQQKIASGDKVFNLSAGEPKLPTHPIIKKAVIHAIEQHRTAYPPVAGVPELRRLASEWMRETHDCNFEAQNCLVTPGGKFGIYLLLQLLLNEQDEVIIPAPFWVSYPGITKIFKGIPRIVMTEIDNDWKITPEQLQAACSEKTRLFILNNATNPTGTLYSRPELAKLLSIAKKNNLIVLSDEVYSELVYDNATFTSCGAFIEHEDHVVVIQSCSKNFSMTGWRVGFVFAPQKLISHLTALNSQSSSGACTVSQWAAISALQEAALISQWVREHMCLRRNTLISAFKTQFSLIVPAPLSALYVFLEMKALGFYSYNSNKFCKILLEKMNVALIPGSAFGKEGFIRCSFGETAEDLQEGIKAVSRMTS